MDDGMLVTNRLALLGLFPDMILQYLLYIVLKYIKKTLEWWSNLMQDSYILHATEDTVKMNHWLNVKRCMLYVVSLNMCVMWVLKILYL